MKYSKIISCVTASLLIILTGCDKEQNGTIYRPNSDDAKEIHFIQSSLTKEFPQGTKTGTIEIELARPSDKGDLSVSLQKKGENKDSFSVPENVTIPDGSYSVKVPVEVNLVRLLAGSSLNATILISDRQEETGDGAYVTQFSDKITLSVSYALEWETFYRTDESGDKVPQTATYRYNAFYTGRDSGLEVEKAVGANIFKVNDWASGVSFKFILNDDNSCTVPAQSIGYYNSNYNEYVKVADMAEYTGNKAAYSSYPCTYDGKGTFSFYLIYYVSAGYFAQGNETLTFDGNEDKTPVVEISFDGIEATETGFKAPRISFYKNEYARVNKAKTGSQETLRSSPFTMTVRNFGTWDPATVPQWRWHTIPHPTPPCSTRDVSHVTLTVFTLRKSTGLIGKGMMPTRSTPLTQPCSGTCRRTTPCPSSISA